MSYLVRFYGSGNEQNLPSGWPAALQPYSPPAYISGSGYALATGGYYNYSGSLTSEIINGNKAGFGVPSNLRYFTAQEYGTYLAENDHLYRAWQTGVNNPSVRERYIAAIRSEEVRRSLEPLNLDAQDVTRWLIRQQQMLVNFVDLLDDWRRIGSWTPLQNLQYKLITGYWGKVKAIRNYSDFLEDKIKSGIAPDIENGWPN